MNKTEQQNIQKQQQLEEMYWELVKNGFPLQSSEQQAHSLKQPSFARIVETFVTYGAYEDPV